MYYKGMKFRRNRNIVSVNTDRGDKYVRFGRIVKKGQKTPEHAIETEYTWEDDGSPVWAVEIPCKFHSLTNMMYGKDGMIYLMYDNKFYAISLKSVKKARGE